MRKGGGKAKGSAFERDICRRLSLWVSNGKHEDCFWRSAMSGGRSTVAHAKGKRLAAQAGDISAVHEMGIPLISKFLVECKTYLDLNYVALLKSKGHLVQFWEEASKQADRYDKQPMLIAKQNLQPATVCLRRDSLRSFGLRAVLIAPKLDLAIVLLDDFLKEASPP